MLDPSNSQLSSEYLRLLSKFVVGLLVKLSEPKGSPPSMLHMASGFVFDGGKKEPFPVIATVKHFSERVVDWNAQGLVQELRLFIRSAENEAEFVCFEVPVHEIATMLSLVDESLDLAVIPVPHELEQILSRHGHQSVKIPKTLDLDADKTECVVVGINAGTVTVYQHSLLWLPANDGFQPTERSAVGMIQIRCVQIKCSSGDAGRLKLEPLDDDAKSVVGMSGGPVFWVSENLDFIFVGQQIAQRLDPKSQYVEYLIANPFYSVIPAIVDLMHKNREFIDGYCFFPKPDNDFRDEEIPF